MNSGQLIEGVFAWKQGIFAEKFEHDAAYTPHVHFIVVIAIDKDAFRGPIPSG